MTALAREVRYALRSLTRTPGFTATAVLVLGLALGANAGVFSLLYALVLRPLPVPEPHTLVQLSTRDSLGRTGDLTWGQFRELAAAQRVFSTVIGSLSQGVLTAEDGTAILRPSFAGVTGNYFTELGASPVVGRLLQDADMDMVAGSSEGVAVIGWDFWQRQYGGDPAVVGRSLRLEAVPVTIVGVAPRGFLGLGITIEADVITPITMVPMLLTGDATLFRGTQRWVATAGRLDRGASLAASRAHIETLWPLILDAARPPDLPPGRRQAYFDSQIMVESGATGVERGLRARYTRPLSALLLIAALLLLVGAVNLCSLIVARMEARRHELGVRIALGAGRIRLMRELTIEGVLIGAAASVVAVLFAWFTTPRLVAFLLRDYLVRTSLEVRPDATVMTAAAALGIGAGGLMAAIAAFVATSPALATLMPGGSRSVARSSRTGKVLIGAQSAVSIVLVTHATLLARNVLAIAQAPSGLTTETVLTDMLQPRPGGYRNVNPDTYYPEALRRVQAVPGVRGAAFSQHRPQLGALPATEAVAPAGSPPELQGAAAETTHVSPGFFTTVGITLLQGRDFSLADTGVTPRVVIVSRDLARRLFGDGRGLGERVRIGNRADWQNVEIVGIAADARLFDLRRGNAAIAYTPALQNGAAANYKALVVRAPEAAIPAIQEAIVALGAELPPSLVTLEYRRGRTILQERLMAVVGGSFAALALVLLLAGLYGLLAYLLSLRRKEFGIRLALGADGGRMARALAGDALAVTGFGLAIGLGAALASVRVLRSVLAATSPYDPLSLVIACVLLLLVTMMATVLPARRAARVDPLAELRRD